MDKNSLETILVNYKINTTRFRDSTELNSYPYMLVLFRELIENEIPPTQKKYLTEYLKRAKIVTHRGLESRLKRAYLSFVREYHLGFLLKEHFDSVYYSEELDILAGIDYIIQHRGYKFNIHAYLDTPVSKYWRDKKNHRHTFVGFHVDMMLDLSRAKKIGRFLLYDNIDVTELKACMDRMIDEATEVQDIQETTKDNS